MEVREMEREEKCEERRKRSEGEREREGSQEKIKRRGE